MSPTGGSGCPFVIIGFLGLSVDWCGCLKAAFVNTALDKGRFTLLNWEGPSPPELAAGSSMAFTTSYTIEIR